MADEFDANISWWSNTRTSSSSSTSFDGSASITTSSVSGPLIDSSLQNPGFGLDWNQSLLTSSSSGRVEPSFQAMLQDHQPLNYHHHQVHSNNIGIQDLNAQQLLGLQGSVLFEPQVKPEQSIFNQRLLSNYQNPSLSMMASSYHGSSSPPKNQSSSINQLQFSNNTAFWNASASVDSEARSSGFYLSAAMPPVQFGSQIYEQKPSCSSLTPKSNLDTAQKKEGGGGGTQLKKARIETPSPLPTFKVRKEKLGDRITALQQLVSPFGKTDTASVLHEAIEYIKFLHDQVNALTNPYLKNGHPVQHQQTLDKPKDCEGQIQDLRSRGLCLVPIESTYPVATETTSDFWTPTFGGSYR